MRGGLITVMLGRENKGKSKQTEGERAEQADDTGEREGGRNCGKAVKVIETERTRGGGEKAKWVTISGGSC